MLKQPKRFKFKKQHKAKASFSAKSQLQFLREAGVLCVYSLESSRVTARQLEAMRRTARKLLKRSGKLWVLPFAHKPVTAKPLEVRMGKGKGVVAYWATFVAPGEPILKLSGVSDKISLKTLAAASEKLPFKTRIGV